MKLNAGGKKRITEYLMKFNRKQREKIFKQLPKNEKNPTIRKDMWGNDIDFHEYDQETPRGWILDKKRRPVHWRTAECQT